MKVLSTTKLAETVKSKRSAKGLTQEQLGTLTGINRVMIGRIEHGNFIPSISQLESLAEVLEFEITDLFVEKEEANTFIALRDQVLSEREQEGVDKLVEMMLVLRQQIVLRRKFEKATNPS